MKKFKACCMINMEHNFSLMHHIAIKSTFGKHLRIALENRLRINEFLNLEIISPFLLRMLRLSNYFQIIFKRLSIEQEFDFKPFSVLVGLCRDNAHMCSFFLSLLFFFQICDDRWFQIFFLCQKYFCFSSGRHTFLHVWTIC